MKKLDQALTVRKTCGVLLALSVASSVNASAIVRVYDGDGGSGKITYTDLGSNQLQLEIDNTTEATVVGPGDYQNSSVITGIVFDLEQDIDAFSVWTFKDGNGVDLMDDWIVELDVSNNITPGNTKVDVSFTTTTGINGGVYNADDPGSNLDNVFPDIATLVLTITDPELWQLETIENDILRMQRVGPGGEGSLKIPGHPPEVSEPGTAAMIALGVIALGWGRCKPSCRMVGKKRRSAS